MRLFAFVALLLLAGCASPAAPLAADPSPAFEASLAQCSGFNGFAIVDDALVAKYVPTNWTMTRSPAMAAAQKATVRIYASHCRDGDLAILATPANVDAASKDKHPNPDIAFEAFASAQPLAAWLAEQGVPSALANVSIAADGVTVTTGGQAAITITMQASPTSSAYSYAEPYATTARGIGWFWGWENVTSAPAAWQVTFGPGSVLTGANALAYQPASAWSAYDLRYEPGAPSQH